MGRKHQRLKGRVAGRNRVKKQNERSEVKLEIFFIIVDNYLYDLFAAKKIKGMVNFDNVNFPGNIKGANSRNSDEIIRVVKEKRKK